MTINYLINFYPLTHWILAKIKNQILLFGAKTSKQPEKISTKKKFCKKTPNILEFKWGIIFLI